MRTIAIRVETDDVLHVEADLLVLKYAKGLHGADRAVASQLGVDESQMPTEGSHLLVDGRPAINAARVMFVGVPSLYEFEYREIRVFGRLALQLAREAGVPARHVAVTLHGPGYGLDEAEAFDQELAGLLEAINSERFPAELELVTFVERDVGRAQRLRAELAAKLPRSQVELSATGGTSQAPASVAADVDTKRHVFVAMPYSEDFEDAFSFAIAPAIRDAGLICERMDRSVFTGDVVQRMRDRIGTAEFMIADVTGSNPNVYLEIGYAWGRGIPTLLVCRDVAELQFDVRGHRCLIYTSIRDLANKLKTDVAELLATSRR